MMGNKYIITFVIGFVSMLYSCDIETSDNGDFDGFWHLEQVDTLATGGVSDFSKARVFWGVQAKLVSVRDVDKDGNFGYYLRFRQTGDSIIMHSPYKNNWHQDRENGGDLPVSDATLLAPYGINNLEEGFLKEHLSGGKMVLRSKTLRLRFKRF